MNAFTFFKLFAICLLSKVLASASKKFTGHDLYMQLYAVLSSHGGESLELVQAIFENAHENFNNDFEDIALLGETSNPEITEYVLSKSVNFDSLKRAKTIRYTLNFHLSTCSSGKCRLTSGEPVNATVLIFLNEISNDGHPELNDILKDEFAKIIETGDLPLIKKFVEAGCNVFAWYKYKIFDIKSNAVKTTKYLVENGYDLRANGKCVFYLIDTEKISATDFQFFLVHGLSLELKSFDMNWLDTAIQKGSFDIAELVYKRGLRPTQDNDYLCSRFQYNIDLFVIHMCKSLASEEATKIMKVRSIDPEGNLSHIPNDILVQEMTKYFYGWEYEKIISNLYL